MSSSKLSICQINLSGFGGFSHVITVDLGLSAFHFSKALKSLGLIGGGTRAFPFPLP